MSTSRGPAAAQAALSEQVGAIVAAALSQQTRRPCRVQSVALDAQQLRVALAGLLTEREVALLALPDGRPAVRRRLDEALGQVYAALAHEVEETLRVPVAECHMEPGEDGVTVTCIFCLQPAAFPMLPVAQPAGARL